MSVSGQKLFKMLSAVRIASSTRPPVMLRVCSITFFLNLTCCDETNDHCSHIIVMFVTISAVFGTNQLLQII